MCEFEFLWICFDLVILCVFIFFTITTIITIIYIDTDI